VVTKKKKAKVKKRTDGAPDDGRAPGAIAAAATEAAPVHDSAMEEPAGLSARERRDAAEAEYQVSRLWGRGPLTGQLRVMPRSIVDLRHLISGVPICCRSKFRARHSCILPAGCLDQFTCPYPGGDGGAEAGGRGGARRRGGCAGAANGAAVGAAGGAGMRYSQMRCPRASAELHASQAVCHVYHHIILYETLSLAFPTKLGPCTYL